MVLGRTFLSQEEYLFYAFAEKKKKKSIKFCCTSLVSEVANNMGMNDRKLKMAKNCLHI